MTRNKRNSFTWDDKREPHHERRKKIMNEVPEVKSLFGVDPLLKYKTLFLVIVQLLIPIYFLPDNLWLAGLILFIFGATISHVLFLAIHEITHDLAFKKKNQNNILAIIANIPLVS